MVNLASRLEGPFSSNNDLSVAMVIVDEKTSLSLVDRLDEVANRELHKNEFKNVTLILRAIEQVISKDTDCIHRLVNQGVVIKMLDWFEKVSEHLKTQQKPSKESLQLIEVFYEVSMSLCQSDVEGNSKILEVLLLRFGAVVIDQEVNFRLRLEAIKTINSMLDSASKESRKKINESENRSILLEEFAKVIIDVGDYEMQVAISEALYRLTSKKMREELAGKWFSYRSFASTFTTIVVKDFETDCRIFLNELNSYFGSSRRVYSFPCVKAFLGFNELFKPQDELLSEFWVDFNVGTSCISFFVHDPEAALWGLINLSKKALSSYSLRECDNRKLLSVHVTFPISHGSITSKTVQIVFDSKHDIQTAVEKVFGAEDSQLLGSPKQTSPVKEDSGVPVTPTDLQSFDSSSVTESAKRAQVSFFPQSGPGRLPSPKGRRIQVEDRFLLRNDSDTEVTVSATLNHTFLTDVSERSHHTKPGTITFMAALWRYQVVRAKAAIFSQHQSSDGSISSVKSLPATVSEVKSAQKRKLRPLHFESDHTELFRKKQSSKDTPHSDYTRKKPRQKTKLKVLPLSSPSSNEEEIKESTPKRRLLEREKTEASSRSLGVSHSSEETPLDSGFQDIVLEDSVFPEEMPAASLENKVSREPPQAPRKRLQPSTELHAGSEVTEKQQQKEEKSPFLAFKPRRLFPYTSLESDTEMTQALMKDEESETEMGSGVIAAFNTFKAQLKEHFSSRYKKIEAKSLRSLTDCQKNVTSLLRTAHQQRLVHLEHFQDTVVQQLGQLEQNCLSLKNIEQETVRFWQSQSGTVKAFCDEQQKRLEALDLLGESVQVSQGQTMTTEETASESSAAHTSLSSLVLNSAETEEKQRDPGIVPMSTTST